MKKIKLIILFFLGLTIFSCSNSEDSNSSQKLIKFEQKKYSNGVLEEKNVFVLENEKPYSAHFYNASNELTHKSYWHYTNGLLTSIKGYFPDGTLYIQSNTVYDSSNRIIQTSTNEDNGSYLRTTNFIYNNNNTITSNTNNNGSNSSKTFEINSNGLIDKEIVSGNTVVSVQYDNSTPISKTVNSVTSNFTYHATGLFPISEQSFFANNPINLVLSRNSLDDTLEGLTNKLITDITSTSSDYQYVYTLNENNFPLTRKKYYNGVLINEFTYYYQ